MITRGKVLRPKFVTRAMVRADRRTVFVFGDNMERRGLGGQAKEMRGEPNTIGVPTKWSPARNPGSYFVDEDRFRSEVSYRIIEAFRQMREALDEGRDVAIPAYGLGTGLGDMPERAPIFFAVIEEAIAALENSEQ